MLIGASAMSAFLAGLAGATAFWRRDFRWIPLALFYLGAAALAGVFAEAPPRASIEVRFVPVFPPPAAHPWLRRSI
jgi:hypothetical protein